MAIASFLVSLLVRVKKKIYWIRCRHLELCSSLIVVMHNCVKQAAGIAPVSSFVKIRACLNVVHANEASV